MCPDCKSAVASGKSPKPCCLPKRGRGVIATCLPYQDVDLYETGVSGEESPTTYGQSLHLDAAPYMVGLLMRGSPEIDLSDLSLKSRAVSAAKHLMRAEVGARIEGASDDGSVVQLVMGPNSLDEIETASVVRRELRAYAGTVLVETEDLGGGVTRVTLSDTDASGSFGYDHLPRTNLELGREGGSHRDRMAYGGTSSYEIPYEFDENPTVGALFDPERRIERLRARIAAVEGGASTWPWKPEKALERLKARLARLEEGDASGAFGNNRLPRAGFDTGSRRVGFGEAGAYEVPYEFDNDGMVGTLGGPAQLPNDGFHHGSRRIYLGEASAYRNYAFDADEMVGAAFDASKAVTSETAPRHAVASVTLWAKSNDIPSRDLDVHADGGKAAQAKGAFMRARSFHLKSAQDYFALGLVTVATMTHWRSLGIPLGVVQTTIDMSKFVPNGTDVTYTGEFVPGWYDVLFYAARETTVSGFGPGVGAIDLPGRLERSLRGLIKWAEGRKIGVDRSTVRASRTYMGNPSIRAGVWGSHFHLADEAVRKDLRIRGKELAARLDGVKFKLVEFPSMGAGWWLGYFTDDADLEVVGSLWLPVGERPARVVLSGALQETFRGVTPAKTARLRDALARLTDGIQDLYEKLDQKDAGDESDDGASGFGPGVGGFGPGVGAVDDEDEEGLDLAELSRTFGEDGGDAKTLLTESRTEARIARQRTRKARQEAARAQAEARAALHELHRQRRATRREGVAYEQDDTRMARARLLEGEGVDGELVRQYRGHALETAYDHDDHDRLAGFGPGVGGFAYPGVGALVQNGSGQGRFRPKYGRGGQGQGGGQGGQGRGQRGPMDPRGPSRPNAGAGQQDPQQAGPYRRPNRPDHAQQGAHGPHREGGGQAHGPHRNGPARPHREDGQPHRPHREGAAERPPRPLRERGERGAQLGQGPRYQPAPQPAYQMIVTPQAAKKKKKKKFGLGRGLAAIFTGGGSEIARAAIKAQDKAQSDGFGPGVGGFDESGSLTEMEGVGAFPWGSYRGANSTGRWVQQGRTQQGQQSQPFRRPNRPMMSQRGPMGPQGQSGASMGQMGQSQMGGQQGYGQQQASNMGQQGPVVYLPPQPTYVQSPPPTFVPYPDPVYAGPYDVPPPSGVYDPYLGYTPYYSAGMDLLAGD